MRSWLRKRLRRLQEFTKGFVLRFVAVEVLTEDGDWPLPLLVLDAFVRIGVEEKLKRQSVVSAYSDDQSDFLTRIISGSPFSAAR